MVTTVSLTVLTIRSQNQVKIHGLIFFKNGVSQHIYMETILSELNLIRYIYVYTHTTLFVILMSLLARAAANNKFIKTKIHKNPYK